MAKKAKVWDGSAWQDLASATTDLTPYSTTAQMNTAIDAGSGLKLITSATIGTAVTSVTVSNVFSSTYNNYRVVIDGIDGSTITNIRLQFGSATTDYYSSIYYDSSGGGSTGTDRTSNGSSVYAGVTGTDFDTCSSFDIYSPNLARKSQVAGNYQAGQYTGFFGGVLANTTQYTAFNLIAPTGTMTGGTIKIYGYKN